MNKLADVTRFSSWDKSITPGDDEYTADTYTAVPRLPHKSLTADFMFHF